MSMVTYPLNNIEYTAEDAELFHSTRTSGVYATDSFDYSVTSADNSIVIGTGIAWIKNRQFSGKVVAQKEPMSLDMGLPDPTYPRIDAVVIQFNSNKNATEIVVKNGVASSFPIAPEVVRTESLYELHLYHVRREAGSLSISAPNITDLRNNNTYCGLMSDSITKAVDSTLSKNGVAADAAATGAAIKKVSQNKISKSGDNVSGWLNFTGTTQGVKWKTADGTEFQIRPYTSGNILQIVRVDTDGKSHATMNVSNEGQVTFGEKALPIGSGGTGGMTAASARENLGITPTNIGAAPTSHKHTKSQITDFPTSMPASDVSAWAKAATKPSYTASEVGALPTSGGTMTGVLDMTANLKMNAGESETADIVFARPSNYDYDAHIDLNQNKLRFYRYSASGEYKQVASIDLADGIFWSEYVRPTKAVEVAYGGTGAKTAAGAIKNLGALAEKWGSVSATANGVLTDALNISTSAADGQYNVPKLVTKGTTTKNMPPDCEMGVRTVHFHSSSSILVRIDGIATDGTAGVWYNIYNGSGWKVWKRIDMVLESGTYAGCYYRYVNSVIEWMNPPMVLNTEYKTVERWQGKAVYTKLVFGGLIPANGQKTFAHNASATHIIRCIASADDGASLPYFYYPTSIDVMATKTEVQIFAQNRTAEVGNVYAQIWYTKD